MKKGALHKEDGDATVRGVHCRRGLGTGEDRCVSLLARHIEHVCAERSAANCMEMVSDVVILAVETSQDNGQ